LGTQEIETKPLDCFIYVMYVYKQETSWILTLNVEMCEIRHCYGYVFV